MALLLGTEDIKVYLCTPEAWGIQDAPNGGGLYPGGGGLYPAGAGCIPRVEACIPGVQDCILYMVAAE